MPLEAQQTVQDEAGPSQIGIPEELQLQPPRPAALTFLQYDITALMTKPYLYIRRNDTITLLTDILGLPEKLAEPLRFELYWRSPTARIRVLPTYVAFYDSWSGRLVLSRQLLNELGITKGDVMVMHYLGWRKSGGGDFGKEPVYCFKVDKKRPEQGNGEGDLAEFTSAAAEPSNKMLDTYKKYKDTAPQTGVETSRDPVASASALDPSKLPAIIPVKGILKTYDILLKHGSDADKIVIKTAVLKPLCLDTLDIEYPLRRFLTIELIKPTPNALPVYTTLGSYAPSRVAYIDQGKYIKNIWSLRRHDYLRLRYRGYRKRGGGENSREKVYCFFAEKVHRELVDVDPNGGVDTAYILSDEEYEDEEYAGKGNVDEKECSEEERMESEDEDGDEEAYEEEEESRRDSSVAFEEMLRVSTDEEEVSRPTRQRKRKNEHPVPLPAWGAKRKRTGPTQHSESRPLWHVESENARFLTLAGQRRNDEGPLLEEAEEESDDGGLLLGGKSKKEPWKDLETPENAMLSLLDEFEVMHRAQ